MSNTKLRAGIIAGVAIFMMTLGGVFYALLAVDAPSSMESPEMYAPHAIAVSEQATPAVHPPAIVENVGNKPSGQASADDRPRFVPVPGPDVTSNTQGSAAQEPSGQPVAQPPTNTPREAGSADAAETRRVQIQDAFRGQMDGFRDCYELILELEPNLGDRLVLELLVHAGDPDPTTELISIESGRMGVEHIECFAEVAAQMQMPAPDGGAEYTVRYPIVLSTE